MQFFLKRNTYTFIGRHLLFAFRVKQKYVEVYEMLFPQQNFTTNFLSCFQRRLKQTSKNYSSINQLDENPFYKISCNSLKKIALNERCYNLSKNMRKGIRCISGFFNTVEERPCLSSV